jgi:uncharacterized protein (DUF433 family)
MAELPENPVTDWTDCPLVEINLRKLSGTPVLKGTRMAAGAILENYVDGLPAEEIAEAFELPADSVLALVAYAEQRNPAFKPVGRAWAALSEPSFASAWSNPEDDVYDAL